MDEFTEKAFKDLEQREVEAYEAIDKKKKLTLHLAAALLVGTKEMAQLIKLAEDNGIVGVLREYADAVFMAGFKAGYDAGKESMM